MGDIYCIILAKYLENSVENTLSKPAAQKVVQKIVATKKALDGKVWNGDGSDAKLKPEILDKLKKVAMDLWSGLAHGQAELLDIVMTGSTSGYRWLPNSDIDLHLIVQMGDFDADEALVDSYCRARTKLWNKEHEVDIEGHPVEVYIQDVDEPHHAANVYSIMNNEWVKGPEEPEEAAVNKMDVVYKAMHIAKDVERLIDTLKKKPSMNSIEAADRLRERIRKMRAEGLQEEGELSVENIVFKVLRQVELLDQLDAAKREAYDSLVSK